MINSRGLALSSALALLWFGCSSPSNSDAPGEPGGGGGTAMPTTSGAGGTGGSMGGGANVGGGGAAGGAVSMPPGGNPIAILPGVTTTLPAVNAGLTNLVGTVMDDSVSLTFDPVDGAADYRVYPLPADADIDIKTDPPTIKNATYRCAGTMEKSSVSSDDGKTHPPANNIVQTLVTSAVSGYTRTMDEATLGYVYPEPGDGLVPVWALGNPAHEADGVCVWAGYESSRVKTYTSSKADHDMLVSQGWRDDGIKFYVPAKADATTQPLYTASSKPDGAGFYGVFYFASAKEQTARMSLGPTAADFVVLKSQAPKTKPLMRFWYQSACQRISHDELVVGKARFDNAYHQGNYPATALTWSGITQPTVLVVEALGSGCPYQGMLAATHIDAAKSNNGATPHEPYVTLSEMRAASATGEVYVNGQYDTTTRPKVIARSFVKVEPQAPPKMDFFDGFHEDPGFMPAQKTMGINCAQMLHFTSPKYELSVYCMQDTSNLFSSGMFLGQFWVTYSDNEQDTNGKVRIQPKQLAQIADSTFIHATMSIDSVTTHRRYPQILISDQTYPVQENMMKGNTVVVETISSWPPEMQIQFCDHAMWDVNAQCPHYNLYRQDAAGTNVPPVPYFGEHITTDRVNQYDFYVSTKRAYIFFDGQPYGCADLPADKLKTGQASVTFGDVLYHSGADVVGADIGWIYEFHVRHLSTETRHHYDNIGFSSGVPAPAWNEKLIPCQSTLIK
jgi:hypothetical protein